MTCLFIVLYLLYKKLAKTETLCTTSIRVITDIHLGGNTMLLVLMYKLIPNKATNFAQIRKQTPCFIVITFRLFL